MNKSDDLVQVLEFIHDLADHTSSPLPVLVDLNLHYRMLKMVYSKAYSAWDVGHYLCKTPPLFGIWHVYKQICISVHRQFHSAFIFLLRGAVAANSLPWSKSAHHIIKIIPFPSKMSSPVVFFFGWVFLMASVLLQRASPWKLFCIHGGVVSFVDNPISKWDGILSPGDYQ